MGHHHNKIQLDIHGGNSLGLPLKVIALYHYTQAILDLKVWTSSCEFIIPVPHSKFYSESPTKEEVQYPFTSQSSDSKTISETLL